MPAVKSQPHLRLHHRNMLEGRHQQATREARLPLAMVITILVSTFLHGVTTIMALVEMAMTKENTSKYFSIDISLSL